MLTYMGDTWGKANGPRKSDEWMSNYIKKVNEQGGVATMDVNVADNGIVYEAHLKQLIAIRKSIRGLSYPRASHP